MLEVQRYLRSDDGSLEGLREEFGIRHNRHRTFPNLITLKYNQIDSPMGVRLVQECRGLILDEEDDWNVVARPFDKFFNHGQGHAAEIDWLTAKVQEKMDGSLLILYHYADDWHVATSGLPDAAGGVQGFSMTFADLFWSTWAVEGYRLPVNFPGYTFMFELTSKFNRIVVPHDEPHLVLIGVRGPNGREQSTDYWAPFYRTVTEFPLSTMDDVLTSLDRMDPLKQEGYVIVDESFNRVKVKHPGYVAVHHMRDTASPKAFLEVIRSGESPEFLTYFPEFESEFLDIKGRYDRLVGHLEEAYEEIQDIEVQKDFALKAVKTRHPGTLFSLRSGKVSTTREALGSIHIYKLMSLLGLRGER